ncbi:MAG: signal recognition particle-docking protein FtsY [Thermoanaerobaculia bacterium]
MSDYDELAVAADLEEAAPRPRGLWSKLKQGLSKTHEELLDRIGAAVSDRGVIDEETLEGLEEALIGADLGVKTAMELIESLRGDIRRFEAKDEVRLRQRLVDEVAVLLLDAPRPAPLGVGPVVTLVVGVNGAGKTTTIAKLARRAQDEGRRVLLAAADTFRAAAIEQLVTWGERLGVDVIRQAAGADPGAVVFDALAAARARKVDEVVVDTAGRLHTKDHLMAELAKVRRVIERAATDGGGETAWFQQRTLLVLDATTGQNAIVQAREFHRITPVDAVVLAKLDGTAKGGVAVAIARELRMPILYLGVGERPEDLVEFHPREFAAALLG